ncbi:hypothetical protein [Shinella zoogloeoides]|uniref:hypothetical protein n=1 Tax=Shinella zoogloeoides TaxID=352475 RepID=UPI00299D7D22|nr:hypothetical protein [Shinella zoogloeoides]
MSDTMVAKLSAEISARMIDEPALPIEYASSSSLETLIADFVEQGVAERGYLTSGDLKRVAFVKNGEKLSNKTKDALASNTEEAVRQFTKMALSANDPEFSVRILLGLDGVHLPTASCILAWTLPHKWPVIDVRSWRSIARLSHGQV